jgi:transcriptional regulator
MHSNPAFRWDDQATLRDFVREVGFGALFAMTPDGPRVAHAPAIWLDETILGFHLARGNALARHLDGATALFVVQGPDAYISPNWYGLGPNQVPTWNYVAVELEGRITRMEQDDLVAQVDALSAEHEARLAPKQPWTRAKMDPALANKMLAAITGFRLEVTHWRGTNKLGQHKPEAARLATADALAAQGRQAMAALIRAS